MSGLDTDRLKEELSQYEKPPEELVAADVDDLDSDQVLDVRGEVCPHPVNLAVRKLASLQSGQVLKEITDHTMSTHNVPKAVKNKGLGEVIGIKEPEAGVYELFIRRE